jgi:hypothetical protein
LALDAPADRLGFGNAPMAPEMRPKNPFTDLAALPDLPVDEDEDEEDEEEEPLRIRLELR